MGLYNVIQPCGLVSGGAALQFVRPTPEFQPVELDDDAAAPLVAEGKLSEYRPGGVEGKTGDVSEDPSPRRPRRRADDEG